MPFLVVGVEYVTYSNTSAVVGELPPLAVVGTPLPPVVVVAERGVGRRVR